jgi:hypothetical protein
LAKARLNPSGSAGPTPRAAFFAREPPPYEIVGKHQDDGLEYAFIGYARAKVPPRLAVLAGEIVHHLRSSLDHLIHALIVKNGGTPSNNNQFPICKTPKEFERSCNSGQIKGVSRSAKKIIRSVQPYTTRTPEDTILYVVNKYGILDKHKLLVVVCTVAQLGRELSIWPDLPIANRADRPGKAPKILGFSDASARHVTGDGVKLFSLRLAEPAPELHASAKFIAQIAFEECGLCKLVPVLPTLTRMFKATVNTVDSFQGEF